MIRDIEPKDTKVMELANYRCQVAGCTMELFIEESTDKPFLEVHRTKDGAWALCSTHYSMIHHGNETTGKAVIDRLQPPDVSLLHTV